MRKWDSLKDNDSVSYSDIRNILTQNSDLIQDSVSKLQLDELSSFINFCLKSYYKVYFDQVAREINIWLTLDDQKFSNTFKNRLSTVSLDLLDIQRYNKDTRVFYDGVALIVTIDEFAKWIIRNEKFDEKYIGKSLKSKKEFSGFLKSNFEVLCQGMDNTPVFDNFVFPLYIDVKNPEEMKLLKNSVMSDQFRPQYERALDNLDNNTRTYRFLREYYNRVKSNNFHPLLPNEIEEMIRRHSKF